MSVRSMSRRQYVGRVYVRRQYVGPVYVRRQYVGRVYVRRQYVGRVYVRQEYFRRANFWSVSVSQVYMSLGDIRAGETGGMASTAQYSH